MNGYFAHLFAMLLLFDRWTQVLCQNGLQVRSRVVLCTVGASSVNGRYMTSKCLLSPWLTSFEQNRIRRGTRFAVSLRHAL